MARNFACSLCNSSLKEHPVSFVQDGTLWTVNVLLCKNEKCMLRRGAVSVEHMTEQGPKNMNTIREDGMFARQKHFQKHHPELIASDYSGGCPGGCTITKEDYPKLFEALKEVYSNGDEFKLPELGER